MSKLGLKLVLRRQPEVVQNFGSIQLPNSTIYRIALLFTITHGENTCKEGSVCPVWITILCVLDNKDVYINTEKSRLSTMKK